MLMPYSLVINAEYSVRHITAGYDPITGIFTARSGYHLSSREFLAVISKLESSAGVSIYKVAREIDFR